MKQINIYLADLRHNYLGYVSSDAMPLGVGYMKAVMDKQLSNACIKVFAYPDKLEQHIAQCPPDVLMLTNYIWNEALSLNFAKFAKKHKPNCLTVVGGPNMPIENERRKAFLKTHPYVDLYALGEGDFFAAELIRQFLETDLDIEKLLSRHIHSSVYKKNGEFVVTDILPRSKNLDDIPSPWLNGVMDEFFDGMLVPLFETNRGCPFSCTFCVQGTEWYQKVNYFSLERIQAEIEYIGKKISTDFPQQKMLRIADPNFGMFNRDIEIAGYLGETQRKYNYPLLIDATTGKNRADNIIKTMEKVNGALVLYQAVQSLDDEVLDNIQRSNIKLSSYEEIQVHIKGRGLKSSSDLIVGLPGESLQKHIDSLEKIINAGTDKLNNFQAMLLKGSNLETTTTRKKYNFKTMFRLLPKCHGMYGGEKVFDTDEIVVSTKDLSFDDYLEARTHHIAINVFWNFTRFTGLTKVTEQFGFTPWQWIESAVHNISDNTTSVYPLLNQFISETKNELFETEQELFNFYSQPEIFERLNTGEIGDNLIYKYRALAHFFYWEEVVDAAISATIKLLTQKSITTEFQHFLIEYGQYMKYSYASGKTQEEFLQSGQYEFEYDFELWAKNDFSACKLKQYKLLQKKIVSFELSDVNKKYLSGALEIWSYDLKSFSMFIKRIHNDWLKKEVKEMSLTVT